MQFFLTNKTMELNCLMFQNDLHYVYKLTIRKTGQYYIGCTNNLKKRVDEHGYWIDEVMLRESGDHSKNCKKFHQTAGEALRIDEDALAKERHREIRKGILVQVLGVVVGREPALHLERKYITDAQSDILCLNAQ